MVTNIVFTTEVFLFSAIMMVGSVNRQGDLVSCNLYLFLHYPVIIIHLTFLPMSVDKVIAIKLPYKHD